MTLIANLNRSNYYSTTSYKVLKNNFNENWTLTFYISRRKLNNMLITITRSNNFNFLIRSWKFHNFTPLHLIFDFMSNAIFLQTNIIITNFITICFSNLSQIFFFKIDSLQFANVSNNKLINKNFENKPFIYFSYLEGFDNISSNIILNYPNVNSTTKILNVEDYKKLDQQYLTLLDREFYNKLLKDNNEFNYWPFLYEFEDDVPYLKNNKFESWVYYNYNWFNYFDIGYRWATNDLVWTFYYEPFFYFWTKNYQSLDEFWLICFFRQWALLLEDWIFPTTVVKKKVIFTPLQKMFHPSELRSGLKVFKRLYDFKATQSFSYYVNFTDVQDYALDKNFLHIWNYWIGAKHNLNIFTSNGGTGLLNFFREKLYTPRVHVSSKYFRNDIGFGSYNTRLINFVFFPDMTLLNGLFSPAFDDMTSGYNWFFHFGDTFMDSTMALNLIWYQLTYNLWGSFDYLVQDYSFYQPTYFSDNLASVRIPMILLVCKKYNSPSHMNMFIWDYNTVFQFKKFKTYKNLRGEIFYPLSQLQRLEKLWDVQPIDQKLFEWERLATLFFGYNYSQFPINYPIWFKTLNSDVNGLFQTFQYDFEEDKDSEETFRWLIDEQSRLNYNYNSNISIYFNELEIPNFISTLYNYINEKVFDNPGYYYTNRNRSQPFKTFNSFSWLENISLLYIEYLPQQHYNWKISVFGYNIFDWNLIQNLQNQNIIDEIVYVLSNTIKIGFKNQIFLTKIQAITHRLFFAHRPIGDNAFYIELDFAAVLLFLKLRIPDFFLFNCMDVLIIKIDSLLEYFTNLIRYSSLNKLLLLQENFSFLNNFLSLQFFKFNNYFQNYFNNLIILKPFINLINYSLNLLTAYFFEYDHKTIILKSYILTDVDYKYAVCCAVWIEFRLLPLVFYLPFFSLNEVDYMIIKRFVISHKDLNTFSTSDFFKNLHNFSDFENFTNIWLIHELNKTALNERKLLSLVNAINNVDTWPLKLRSLEYQRYNTYVLKHSCYKSSG